MAFPYAHGLTPYEETRHMHGRAQHKGQPEMHATATYMFPDATLDEGSTLMAIETLKANLPLPVLKHIIQLPPKCIEALLVLLNQVQNNISVDWLTDVIACSDPEENRITVSQTPSQALHDNGSFWTESSATTCHASALSIDGGIGLSRQPSTLPNTYNTLSSCYYEATLPNHLGNGAFVFNVEGNNFADPSMMPSPFGSQPDIDIFTSTPENIHSQLEFPNEDFVLIDPLTPCPVSNETTSFTASFPPLQNNSSESTVIDTQRSNTIRQRRSRRSTKASTQEGSLNIQMYSVPQASAEEHRSPCPLCDSCFVSHTEFAAHIVAEHDRPTGYRCSHLQCDFVTYRATLLNRHHTNYHKCCSTSQPRGVGTLTPCCHVQHKSHQKKTWGCWLCTWETQSGPESWARHQLEQHKGCQREQLSHTWLIKSLLSQPRLRTTWQAEIKQLEKTTSTVWNLKWSDSRADPIRDSLIEALETGIWQGKNYHTDDFARQALVRAVRDATKDFRVALDQTPRHERTSVSKRPLSPAPVSLRRLRSFGQNLRARFTHESTPAPDTSMFISSPRRQDSLPIRTSGRNRPATSHEIV